MRPHAFVLPLLMMMMIGAPGAGEARAEGPEDSIVRVFATLRMPNPIRPWSKQAGVEVMGTGVVIDGRRILTNAHIVQYASEVFVQPYRGGDRVGAKVASIGPAIDLATLTLEDEAFFDGRPPIPRAEKRPAANDSVILIGFPVGGSGPAVSRGVISRIDFAGYTDLTEGLRIQVDAVAGPGNSGGPALVDGKMVGMVFRRAQNMGIVIPEEEIALYLDDVKDGRYDGKPRIIDHFQTLINPTLRKRLGLAAADRGVMVTRPGQTEPANPLREGDVVTRVGTVPIDNEGMVDFDDALRLPFSSLVPRLAQEGGLPVRLIRDGRPMEIHMTVTRDDDRLIRPFLGRYPSYFVHGPLIFSPVMDEAVAIYGQGNPLAMLDSPMSTRGSDRAAFPGEELVVVTSQMLAHPMTRGYVEPFGHVVKDIDGTPVKNFAHLVELLRNGRGEFVTIRFFSESAETMVFPRQAMEEATPELMADNGIPRRGTEDAMAVWNKKAAE